MLRINGLTKRYRTGDLALKGVDLVVPDGQDSRVLKPGELILGLPAPLNKSSIKASLLDQIDGDQVLAQGSRN